MLRLIVGLLLTLFVLTILRGIVGIIGKAFTSATLGGSPRTPQPHPPKQPPGVLRKDPVCGVYVSESAAVTLEDKSGTVYFCSENCRNRYRGTRT